MIEMQDGDPYMLRDEVCAYLGVSMAWMRGDEAYHMKEAWPDQYCGRRGKKVGIWRKSRVEILKRKLVETAHERVGR